MVRCWTCVILPQFLFRVTEQVLVGVGAGSWLCLLTHHPALFSLYIEYERLKKKKNPKCTIITLCSPSQNLLWIFVQGVNFKYLDGEGGNRLSLVAGDILIYRLPVLLPHWPEAKRLERSDDKTMWCTSPFLSLSLSHTHTHLTFKQHHSEVKNKVIILILLKL